MANTIKFGNGQWATKEDSILAYNDENANFKPLPFVTSRATTATRVNKAGLLETVASGVPRVDYLDNSKGSYLLEPTSRNLIAQSEAFGNSYWTKSGASIQGDASTVGSEQVVNGNFATDSDWTKQTGWTISGGGANYDFLSNVKYIRQTLLNGGIVSGNTYQINFEITSGTAYISINSNSGVLISSNTYSVGSHSISINASVSGSDLLIYGRNTQGTAFSIDNVSVKEVQGFSAPSVDSPLGAFKLVENSGTGQHRMSATISSPSAIHTISAFFKPIGTNRKAYLDMGSVTGFFDFTTKVFTSATGVGSYEEVSDGWYKLSLTSNSAITISAIYIGLAISNETYTGDGTSGVYIFASQLEQKSYATSYIKTEGSTQTRLQDTASKSGISSLINSSEGVLYFEGSALAEEVIDKRIALSDGTMNNYVSIGYSRFSGNIIAEMKSGGVLQTLNFGASGVTKTNNNKFAFSWGSGTMKFYVNGIQKNTESVTSPIGMNNLRFSEAEGAFPMFSNTRDLRVYNTELTDAQLTTLTTI